MSATVEAAAPAESPAIVAFRQAFQAQSIAGRFTDQQLELIYRVGYQQYQSGQYLEAVRCFLLLTVYRPFSLRYLKALALAQFMVRHYEQAALTCSFLLVLDPTDVEALYVGGQALLLDGQKVEARKCLAEAVSQAERRPDIGKRAQAILELMDRK